MNGTNYEPFALISWIAGRSRRQVQVVAALVATYLAWRLLRWAAAVELDRWWLDSVTDASVWRVRTGAIVLLAVVSFVVSTGIMWAAWTTANRTPAPSNQPTFRPIAFVAGRLGPARTWAAWLMPLYFGIRILIGSTEHWQKWVLFRNSDSLGITAPEVGRDLSYHLFTLPLAEVVLGWLSGLTLATLAGAWVLLVFNGALRLHIRGRRSNPRAIRLMLGLSALFFVVQAANYWFVQQPALASSTQGRIAGATWSELNSRGIAYRPLAIACVICAVLLVASVSKKVRFRYSLGFVGLVVVAHIVFINLMTPALQRLIVNPSEFSKDAPYLQHNLEWTKRSYGLSDIQIESLTLDPNPDDVPKPDRIPQFEQSSLAKPFQVLQGSRGSKVIDVDLDRYLVDGEPRPVFVAARVAAQSELPDQSWVNTHLVYTHGDGVVAALADETTSTGGLNFDGLQDRLGRADVPLYFGAGLDDWFVVVGTNRNEFGGAEYDGMTGIGVGSRWRQSVAGMGLGDYNLAITSELDSDSRLLFRRSISERLGAVAPFLAVDGDPYPVVTDQGVTWMVDTYATSRRYPYAQPIEPNGVPDASGLSGIEANHVEHAAVATIDATDGTVHLYRTHTDAPIVDAWDRALPGLFEDLDDLPPQLAVHRRYPTDGYTVQTNLLGRYHVDDAAALYSGDDAWLISRTVQAADDDAPSPPSRSVWQFANDLGGAWVSVRPWSPGQARNPSSGRDELTALAVGDHDAGTLTIYRTSPSTPAQLPSPEVAQSVLASDPEISQLLTLLNANGSTVVFGPSTPMLDGGGLWWYRTIVVNSTAKVSTPRVHSSVAVDASGVTVVTRTDTADLTVGDSSPLQPAETDDAGANGDTAD